MTMLNRLWTASEEAAHQATVDAFPVLGEPDEVRNAADPTIEGDFQPDARPFEEQVAAYSGLPRTGLLSVSAADLLAEPEPDTDWLADHLFPASGVALLAGDPKSFKTLCALQLAVVVGTPAVDDFLGRSVRHGPVLFVEEEGSRHKYRERMQMMMAGLGSATAPDLTFVLHQGIRLDEARSLKQLTDVAADIEPVLVVLDPLVMLHSGDENKASEMGRVMRGLVALAAERECCVAIVHHVNKPQQDRKPTRQAQRMRGSSAFAGATDANLIMDRDGDRTASVRAEFRDAEPFELYIQLDTETLLLSPTEPPQSARKIGRDVLLAFVGERGQVGVTLTAEHFGATRNTARNALEEAVATRHLDTAMDGRRTMYFPRAA